MLGFKTMILLTAAATHALAATATRANLQLCGDRNFGKCEDIDFIVGDCGTSQMDGLSLHKNLTSSQYSLVNSTTKSAPWTPRAGSASSTCNFP